MDPLDKTQSSQDKAKAQDGVSQIPSQIDLANLPPFTPGTRPSAGFFSPVSDHLEYPSAASDISGDAVFPIRSVVSVDAGSASESREPREQAEQNAASIRRSRHNTVSELVPPGDNGTVPSQASLSRRPGSSAMRSRRGGLSRVQVEANRHGSAMPIDFNIDHDDKDMDVSEPSGPSVGPSDVASQLSESQEPLPHVTTRFTHAQTEEGHAIITGRDGTLQRCEDEPIHTPGAVQGFGVLAALHEDSDGRFIVRYVSENSERLLGYRPAQLFKLDNFLDILTEEQQDNLLDHIDFIRDEDADPCINGPEIFALSIKHPKTHKTAKLWCGVHINGAHPDLVMCEFEMQDDELYPLRPTDEVTPDEPVDTLDSNPTREEIEQSTEMLSKPLRILRSARKRRGEQGAMQVFDIMSQVQEQLAAAQTEEHFLKVLVGIVKELTGFHRIMIYQFDASFNGKVVTELVDTVQTKDLYKGLHFPASDIPRQARELYKINKVRLLYDREQETARIVCRTKDDLAVPLDMTHAYLRAMSPIHLKYLGHMGVRSSMSISIDAFSELWGLIACHSYGDNGMRVSFPIRKMCRLVGETASRNIERLAYTSRLQARKLINTSATDKNPSGYIIASSTDLLKLFDADFGLLSIAGETKMLGTTQHSQEALALLEYLRIRKLTSVTSSQDVRVDFRDLKYAPGFQGIAGLLYVPLSAGGNDFIVFFRKGQVEEINWAGNPYEKSIRHGTESYLEPRSSFRSWRETVVGKSRHWKDEQIETAAVLCIVYGKFIQIWRQKEAALESSKLTKLLLSNSAHEVRTPLNAIINYIELALEGNLDAETRENLTKSRSASKSLIYVINDLLDLTKTEEGHNLIEDDAFDLSNCIKDATEPFYADAKRKDISLEVVSHPGLPQFVFGDERRIRQTISNLVANAVTHTDAGVVKVDIATAEANPDSATLEFVVADTGAGMSEVQVESLFRDLEQVGETDLDERPPEVQTLGLGLALVGHVVRRTGGQLRLKSEVGRGSRFVVQIPFRLPEQSPGAGSDSSVKTKLSTERVPLSKGEVVLMDHKLGDLGRRQSRDGSIASSGKRSGSQGSQGSDAHRLINAIQTPLSHQDLESGGVLRKLSLGNIAKQAEASASQSTDTEVPGGRGQHADFSNLKPGSDLAVNLTAQTELVQEYRGAEPLASKPPKLTELDKGQSQRPLQVLIAEDDPVNMRVLTTRLERAGHKVFQTLNGEDCAAFFKKSPEVVDVVLMDMQMPIVDGLTSTKMIRKLELTPDANTSNVANINGRVPIFAVSASLEEVHKDTYTSAGFDGWILKPVDFKRLSTLMDGAHDDKARTDALYVPGHWEQGGWFVSRGSQTT